MPQVAPTELGEDRSTCSINRPRLLALERAAFASRIMEPALPGSS